MIKGYLSHLFVGQWIFGKKPFNKQLYTFSIPNMNNLFHDIDQIKSSQLPIFGRYWEILNQQNVQNLI